MVDSTGGMRAQMCGIAGCWTPGGTDAESADAAARAMAATLRHRGPDDAGTWCDPAAGIALGHRRLSILDLTPEGHQPMPSHDGRWMLVFNGEIYNFGELRRSLEGEGVRFRGHSDTEVLVEGIARWGVMPALRRSAGMFAIALWDRQDRVLYLARDRFGEKPLYYGRVGRTFLFGSELKALRAHPAWRGEIDRDAIALFLRFSCVPAPFSIYRGIAKLLPAHVLAIGADGTERLEPYWSLADVLAEGRRSPLSGSDEDLATALEARLRATIREEMAADVPLGALLSGGIDSSVVVALMQQEAKQPVRTFTIGFREADYDEATHARAVAAHLGTEHTELYVSSDEAQAVIPALPAIYDEPFADVSQIPTFLVARLARRDVTVALSGDGGDEAFGGYNRYFHGERIWGWMAPLPRGLRRASAGLIRGVPPAAWQRLFDMARRVAPSRTHVAQAGDRIHKLAGMLDAPTALDMYLRMCSHWTDPDRVVVDGREPPTRHDAARSFPGAATLVERMMYTDALTYLPDDVLVKVDRAAMAVSLETRAPFLDHRVVELAWRLPPAAKVRHGVGKAVLRDVLYRHVPRSLVERPKMGFGVPIDAWLRGPLRAWAAELLDPERLRREGFLRPDHIDRRWREHLRGERNWQYPLWDVLMFQAWLEAERAAPVAAAA